MDKLVKEIEKLKKSEIKEVVEHRIKEFKEIGKDEEKTFKELCFCILTANFNAEKAIKMQEEIDNGFINWDKNKLEEKLRKLGHRFARKRAEYIVGARKFLHIKKFLEKFSDERKAREWLVKNIKGIGYKEASHFLRNIGYENVAILDFHILDLLEKYKIINKPKSLTKKRYMEIERILEKLAEKTKLSLAELDLYLWYMETGRILK